MQKFWLQALTAGRETDAPPGGISTILFYIFVNDWALFAFLNHGNFIMESF